MILITYLHSTARVTAPSYMPPLHLSCLYNHSVLCVAGINKVQEPSLDLGGKTPSAAADSWVIKAHTKAAAQPATVDMAYMTTEMPHLAPQLGETKTAAESIAAAKRELASYKAASHATALRAVTAARNALETVDREQTDVNDEDAMAGLHHFHSFRHRRAKPSRANCRHLP